MTIVDSSVWIDFFNGKDSRETDLLVKLLQNEPIAIGDIILAEVLQGFRSDQDYRKAYDLLTQLPSETIGGKQIAIKSAENYRLLRKNGITIRKTVDLLIGTFCIENGYSLLHSDRDFRFMSEHLELQAIG